MVRAAVVAHGGAGPGPDRLANLIPCLERAREVLELGGSAIEAAVQFDFQLNISCPKGYMPSKKTLDWADTKNGKINIDVFSQDLAALDSISNLINLRKIPKGSNILLIHTGGTQGIAGYNYQYQAQWPEP